MPSLLLVTTLFAAIVAASAFAPAKGLPRVKASSSMRMSAVDHFQPISQFIFNTLPLADTSISEEDILDVTGQAADLPGKYTCAA
jgi:hypothetical protein